LQGWDGLHFEKYYPQLFSSRRLFLGQTEKFTKNVLFLQKICLCLSPHFQGNVSRLSKSGKKTLLVLAGKQQKCHDRAALNYHYYHFVGHCGAFCALKWRISRAKMYFSPLE